MEPGGRKKVKEKGGREEGRGGEGREGGEPRGDNNGV